MGDSVVSLSTGDRVLILSPLIGITLDYPAIVIPPGRDTADRLDTFVHETLHASCPLMKESEVIRIADDVSTVLWKAGYRLKHQQRKGSP